MCQVYPASTSTSYFRKNPQNKQTNSVAFSPQANYTDWATTMKEPSCNTITRTKFSILFLSEMRSIRFAYHILLYIIIVTMVSAASFNNYLNNRLKLEVVGRGGDMYANMYFLKQIGKCGQRNQKCQRGPGRLGSSRVAPLFPRGEVSWWGPLCVHCQV
jgi:hypothetical protein